MIPQENQNIIIFLKNGIAGTIRLEGIVISWSNKEAVLKSIAETTTIVIQNTSEDILYYKILNTKKEFEELKVKPNKKPDDIKKIAELKVEMNEAEKDILLSKARSHEPTGQKEIKYGLFGTNITLPVAIKHPREETPRPNTGIGQELSGMFRKKHNND